MPSLNQKIFRLSKVHLGHLRGEVKLRIVLSEILFSRMIRRNVFLNRSEVFFEGALSGLRQFLATESPLKVMKNAFYLTSKALFVLKMFKFLS